MSTTEAKIIDARLSGFSLSQIETEKIQHIHGLIFKLCSISGAGLPPNEDFAIILAEQFLNYLLEFGYDELTENEVLLAFKMNARGMRYPGGGTVDKVIFDRLFNVTDAAIILENYMVFRDSLDRKLQNKIDGYE